MPALRTVLLAGIAFGALLGPYFAYLSWQAGGSAGGAAATGLVVAACAGLLFGGALYAFVRSPWVQRQIALDGADLLPGEQLLAQRLANLVVDPRQYRLRPFAFGDLQFLLGMKDKEVIGGALYLTNLRLLFKAHRLNRLRGAVSIFLPSVQTLALRSRWPLQRLAVDTRLAQVEFVLASPEAWRQRIAEAREAFGAAEQATLEPLRQRLPGIEALQPNAALSAIDTLIHRSRVGQGLADAALTPLAALAGLLASELFDRTLVERWSQRMS